MSVKSGFGKHITALRPDQIVKAVKYAYIATPFAYLALVLGRVSFAVSLILLIGTTKFRLCLLNALIIGQFVLNITWIGIILGECRPVQKYWNRTLPGRCLDPKVPFSAGYLSSCTLVYPVTLIRKQIDLSISIQCIHGPCACHLTICRGLKPQFATQNENWLDNLDEPGGFVNYVSFLVLRRTANTLGVVTWWLPSSQSSNKQRLEEVGT